MIKTKITNNCPRSNPLYLDKRTPRFIEHKNRHCIPVPLFYSRREDYMFTERPDGTWIGIDLRHYWDEDNVDDNVDYIGFKESIIAYHRAGIPMYQIFEILAL